MLSVDSKIGVCHFFNKESDNKTKCKLYDALLISQRWRYFFYAIAPGEKTPLYVFNKNVFVKCLNIFYPDI